VLLVILGTAATASAHVPSVFGDLVVPAPRHQSEGHARTSETGPEASVEQLPGLVSYYSRAMAGRRTASGERFNPDALTMAHPSLPFGTLVRITLTDASRSVVVRVNDRVPAHRSRIADVSPAAANALGFLRRGLAQARLEVLSAVAGSRPAASPTDH
jgi:rare lipoprotein A